MNLKPLLTMGKVGGENAIKAGKIIVKNWPKIVKTIKKNKYLIIETTTAIGTIYNTLKDRMKTHSITKPEGITLQGLNNRINQLEQNDLDQTKILSDISQEINNLSEISSNLSTRIIYIFCIASISFIISIYLLIKSFIK